MKPISNAPKDPIARQEVQEASNPEFTEASTRENIQSEEPLSTLFGKIKKFFTDLKSVAFSGSYTDLSDKPTIPTDFVSKANGGTFNGDITIDGQDGTSGVEGHSVLTIGNNIEYGEYGQSRGHIKLYGGLQNFTMITPADSTQRRDIDLPNKSGTIALTSDIPTVNNATLTIQKNGTTVKTFTANASSDVTCNITMTASDVGLGNVGNFKAVSTVASQGLSDTEKSNARANIGAGTSSLAIGTSSSTAAAGNHNHGLLHTDNSCTIANTTTDSGWSMINSSYNGFLLKSIRFNGSSPAWGVGNYGSGICFGGSDTKGLISVAYGSPNIKIAGGNGTKPVWYVELTGTSGKSYNLNNSITNITRSGTTFTATKADGSTFTFTQQDNNTTYSAGTGISLSGTTFSNAGVRAISTGSSNGTISVNTNGTSANVSVKGLGSLAYKSSLGKSDVGLGNCDNTADSNKAVKSAGYTTNEDCAYYGSKYRIQVTNNSGVYTYDDTGLGVKNAARNGFKTCYASAFTVGSSIKLKENIKKMTESEAEKLLDINVVTFDYKRGIGISDGSDAYNQRGCIAEEVNKIIPSVVINREMGTDGSVLEPYAIDYSKFVPYLIKMIQIQDKRITELENQLKS